MPDYHLHGEHPYRIVAVHGGPGAIGSVCDLAQSLGTRRGVLEPFQTKPTIAGLVNEMHELLIGQATLPAVLVGHSWGAWLSLIFAAAHPAMVSTLVLVGSGPFSESFVPRIETRRMGRFSSAEKKEYKKLIRILESEDEGASTPNKDKALSRLSILVTKSDYYEPEEREIANDATRLDGELYASLWKEAAATRKSGRLVRLACKIECPVIAIHGVSDPHPEEGVREPLSSAIKNFDFYLLEKCGHYPWREKYAREGFFRIIDSAIG